MSLYFMDLDGSAPPPIQPDSNLRSLREERFPKAGNLKSVKWTIIERNALSRGVRSLHQTALMDNLMHRYEEALTELDNNSKYLSKKRSVNIADAPRRSAELVPDHPSVTAPFTLSNMTTWPPELSNLKEDLSKIERLNNKELEMYMPATQEAWDKISAYFVKTKSSMDCFIQWSQHDHPSLNKREWNQLELDSLKKTCEKTLKRDIEFVEGFKPSSYTDKDSMNESFDGEQLKLFDLGSIQLDEKEELGTLAYTALLAHAKAGPYDWDGIAHAHGHGRTAIDCLIQYQRNLNMTLQHHRWTEEEDAILRKAVQYYGAKNWMAVAMHLDGRTGQQCLHRWTRCISPYLKRGKWTPEEDNQLTSAVQQFGEHQWKIVKDFVKGRTDIQCRERWKNILDPKINTDSKWSATEDAKLLEITKLYQKKWSVIAERLGTNRTDSHCAKRWKYLQRTPIYKKKQRKALEAILENTEKSESSLLQSLSMPSPVQPTLPKVTLVSSTAKHDLPKRRLELLSKELGIRLTRPEEIIEDVNAVENPDSLPILPTIRPVGNSGSFPPDPFNVQSLKLLWESLTEDESQATSDSANASTNIPEAFSASKAAYRNFSSNDFPWNDSAIFTEEYQTLAKQFKALFTLPLLFGLIKEHDG